MSYSLKPFARRTSVSHSPPWKNQARNRAFWIVKQYHHHNRTLPSVRRSRILGNCLDLEKMIVAVVDGGNEFNRHMKHARVMIGDW